MSSCTVATEVEARKRTPPFECYTGGTGCRSGFEATPTAVIPPEPWADGETPGEPLCSSCTKIWGRAIALSKGGPVECQECGAPDERTCPCGICCADCGERGEGSLCEGCAYDREVDRRVDEAKDGGAPFRYPRRR